MNQQVGRRKFLGLLAASPAAARAAAEEIATQAASRSVALMGSVPQAAMGYANSLSGPGSIDPWEKMRQWTNAEVLAGRIPDHRMRELRSSAPYQARFRDDSNVEGLISISRGYKNAMHVESALRRLIQDEKRNVEERTLWEALMKKFGG